ncbi:MAG: GCN5-related N-acetyltransferase, partial [Mycobacterium sp.]|nr:GCN5-related N-acetyltransferase [Mycobacterium sp.]
EPVISPAPAVHVRLIELDELPAAYGLAALAFGEHGSYAEQPAPTALPQDRRWYGAFDGSGRLIGTTEDLVHEQWWGGHRLASADVAGVAVLPESRGGGAARAMLKLLLEGAYERGAAVSALYPTVAPVYRASGWAVTGYLRSAEVPTALLGSAGRPSGRLHVRPADRSGADQPLVYELYNQLASTREGLLARSDPASLAKQHESPPSWPAGLDGMSLVFDGQQLVGYASWSRGPGYRSEAVLDVPDLLALTDDAARELIAVLGGWRSVTPTVRLRPLAFDAASRLIPWETSAKFDARPWMHRPVDVARAVSGRGAPPHRSGIVDFHLHDPIASWNDGPWRLEVADGQASLTRIDDDPHLRLDVAGFGLLYCGAATPPELVEAGLLHGAEGLGGLNLLMPQTPAELLDYF